MKMIKCPKCGKEIAEGASSCIYCGITKSGIEELEAIHKIKPEEKKPINKTLIITIEALFLLIIIAIYYQLFIPQILDYTETEKLNNRIESCVNDYNGTWNYEKDVCDTDDVGSIEIE